MLTEIDCKIISGFFTVWKVSIPNPGTVQGATVLRRWSGGEVSSESLKNSRTVTDSIILFLLLFKNKEW